MKRKTFLQIPKGKNEYKVGCPVCNDGTVKKCHNCNNKGYTIVIFENGRRIK